MAKRVLYREWRPGTFEEVVGQEHVVHALQKSVQTGEIAHAYLFSGTRGTGKTSLAKIFARAINCLHPREDGSPCNECEICQGSLNGSLLDIIEMDAASNNSVDNIRRITDEVLFLPTLAKYKVYIIDEVHMLSTAAFNALLKTLEEPPAHVVFILATTDPQRIPATILSRCQRYDFKRIPPELMQDRLRLIASANQITIDDEALRTIVSRSDGALRDAISLLDQSRSVFTGPIGREEILQMTGVVNDTFMGDVVDALVAGDADSLLSLIDHLILEGGDLQRFLSSLTAYFRDILVCKTTKDPDSHLQLPRQTLDKLRQLAPLYTQAHLIRQISHLAKIQQEMKQSSNPRITMEVGLIQLLDATKVAAQDIAEAAPDKREDYAPAEKVSSISVKTPGAAAIIASSKRDRNPDSSPQALQASEKVADDPLGQTDKTPPVAPLEETKTDRPYHSSPLDDWTGKESNKEFPNQAASPDPEPDSEPDPVDLDLALEEFSRKKSQEPLRPTAPSYDWAPEPDDEDAFAGLLPPTDEEAIPMDYDFEDETYARRENAPSASLTEAKTDRPEPKKIQQGKPSGLPTPENKSDEPDPKSSPFPAASPFGAGKGNPDLLFFDLGRQVPPTESAPAESTPAAKPQPGSGPSAPSTDPAPISSYPEAKQTGTTGSAPLPKAQAAVEEEFPRLPQDFDQEAFWENFIDALSKDSPLTAIFFNSYPKRIEGNCFLVEFPPDRRVTYDKIKDRKNWAQVEAAFRRLKPAGAWRIECRSAGGTDPDEQTDPTEPEWVRKMKKAAQELEIPMEREE